jgi:hypothetical protein
MSLEVVWHTLLAEERKRRKKSRKEKYKRPDGKYNCKISI